MNLMKYLSADSVIFCFLASFVIFAHSSLSASEDITDSKAILDLLPSGNRAETLERLKKLQEVLHDSETKSIVGDLMKEPTSGRGSAFPLAIETFPVEFLNPLPKGDLEARVKRLDNLLKWHSPVSSLPKYEDRRAIYPVFLHVWNQTFIEAQVLRIDRDLKSATDPELKTKLTQEKNAWSNVVEIMSLPKSQKLFSQYLIMTPEDLRALMKRSLREKFAGRLYVGFVEKKMRMVTKDLCKKRDSLNLGIDSVLERAEEGNISPLMIESLRASKNPQVKKMFQKAQEAIEEASRVKSVEAQKEAEVSARKMLIKAAAIETLDRRRQRGENDDEDPLSILWGDSAVASSGEIRGFDKKSALASLGLAVSGIDGLSHSLGDALKKVMGLAKKRAAENPPLLLNQNREGMSSSDKALSDDLYALAQSLDYLRRYYDPAYDIYRRLEAAAIDRYDLERAEKRGEKSAYFGKEGVPVSPNVKSFLGELGIQDWKPSLNSADTLTILPPHHTQLVNKAKPDKEPEWSPTFACASFALAADMSATYFKQTKKQMDFSPWLTHSLALAQEFQGRGRNWSYHYDAMEGEPLPINFKRRLPNNLAHHFTQDSFLENGTYANDVPQVLQVEPTAPLSSYSKSEWPTSLNEIQDRQYVVGNFANLMPGHLGANALGLDWDFFRILIDNQMPPQVFVNTDRSNRLGDWVRLSDQLSDTGTGHVMMVVGYGEGVDNFDFKKKKYVLLRDSMMDFGTPLKIDVTHLLDHTVGVSKVIDVKRVSEAPKRRDIQELWIPGNKDVKFYESKKAIRDAAIRSPLIRSVRDQDN